MTNETTVEATAAAEAPAKVVDAIAETAETLVKDGVKAAKSIRVATARKTKRQPAAEKITAPRKKVVRRKTRTAARTISATAQKRTQAMTKTNNFFAGFDAVPAFAPFQSLFANAGDRGQELVKKTQKVSEELADLARANVEAIVEASRVASEGAKSIGQDVVAKQRDSVEQTADAIRSLAEAKSPTEYLQLQGEFARASFDRAIAESSKLTESLVKLAGEAFQPLSNRATANAERFNTLVA
jgi:phasin family protein